MTLEQRNKVKGYLYLSPALLVFVLIILFPAIKAVVDSFTDLSLYNQKAVFIGGKNYLALLGGTDFWGIVLRTFWLVMLVVVIQYITGLTLALLLNLELPGTRWMKNVILLPWVVPIAAMAVIFTWIAQTKYGLINIILQDIGLERFTRNWFGDPDFAFPLVVLMHVWRNMPFYAITLYAALKTIPKSLYEASAMDGAGKFRQFWNITLPQIKYPSMIVIILHILFTFNNFDLIYLTTGGGPVGKTEVLAIQVYQIAWTDYEYGKASALGVFMLLIMMIVTIIYIRRVREV